MERARVQTIPGPDWKRHFSCADDADDTDAKEPNPSGLWIRDCVYRACYCLPDFCEMAYGIGRPFRQARSAFLPKAEFAKHLAKRFAANLACAHASLRSHQVIDFSNSVLTCTEKHPYASPPVLWTLSGHSPWLPRSTTRIIAKCLANCCSPPASGCRCRKLFAGGSPNSAPRPQPNCSGPYAAVRCLRHCGESDCATASRSRT